MKIETAKLEGATLDWAVATCEGFTELRRNPHRFDAALIMNAPCERVEWFNDLNFSTNWAQGGPIIEREAINLELQREGLWVAQIFALPYRRRVIYTGCAGTPLIAAMRCYVASKLGAVVEVPDGLAS